MTNFVKHLMIAAVALMASAALASAQGLTADIPFAFQVAGKTLPAGTYRIDKVMQDVYAFRGNGGSAAVAMAAARHDPRPEWKAEGLPKLAFRCGSVCVLADLWQANSGPAYAFKQPKSVEMGTRIAVVSMRPAGRAD